MPVSWVSILLTTPASTAPAASSPAKPILIPVKVLAAFLGQQGAFLSLPRLHFVAEAFRQLA
jgi:hypothetical protein